MSIILLIRLVALTMLSAFLLSIMRVCNVIDTAWTFIVTPLILPALCGLFGLILLKHWYWIVSLCTILLTMIILECIELICVSWWDMYIILILMLSTTPIGFVLVTLNNEI